MLDQAILFVVAKSTLAHRLHDNPKIELSGSAPKNIIDRGNEETGSASKCFFLGESLALDKRITQIIAYFDKAIPETDTKRCMIFLLTQSLGVLGALESLDASEKSVFRAKNPHVDYLTLNDKILVRTLYDKRIKPGMARDDAMKIAAEIIPELVAAVKKRGVEALYQKQ